jgi:hypothetical protein
MKKILNWVLAGSVFLVAYVYIRPHFPPAAPVVEATQAAEIKPKVEQPDPLIVMRGPLVDYMQQEAPSEAGATDHPARGPFPGDRIVGSPAGTSLDVVRRTFALKTTAKFAFEIPAHATSPQLRGSYQSSVRREGAESSDESADVEFLLMNEPQYAELLRGRQVTVLFFVQSSHSQQVQFALPATMDQPARYCLVFRNRTGGEAKKIVHAEFRVDL